MDFWQRARSFAEKKSEELRQGIASTNLSDVVSEKSKEFAAEASKKSKEFAAEALKRAAQIKDSSNGISSANLTDVVSKKSKEFAVEALKRADQIAAQIKDSSNRIAIEEEEAAGQLEKYGVTDELKEFIKGITITTFQDFPLQDEAEMSGIPMVSNVRQDLTKWQEKHAKLVLLHVKEISKLRYQLCPRVMKERKFWRIYFILVKSYVEPYEKSYMEDLKVKAAEMVKDTEVKGTSSGTSSEKADEISKLKSNNLKSADTENDLDAFLLGDPEDSDDCPDDGEDGFDEDFDKI